jgi:subtilisin family serine protease
MIKVILNDANNATEFKRLLVANGYQFDTLSAIKKIIKVYANEADFTLSQHPYVKSIVAGQGKSAHLTYSPSEQNITVNLPSYIVDGVWALPRIIRRKSPWNVKGVVNSVNTSFKCNRSGEGVDIYVVDTGVHLAHPEFEGRAESIRGSATPNYFHGTGVASNAAGKTYGIAKKSRIYSALHSINQTSITDEQLADALDDCLAHYLSRAHTNRPAVMTLSVGGFEETELFHAAIEECIDAGIVAVTAANNYRISADIFSIAPYSYTSTDIITAGGSNINDNPFYESPAFGTVWGNLIDIYAPSQEIKMAWIPTQGPDRTDSGTSFGCPFTAGVIACMLEGYARLVTDGNSTAREKVRAVKARLIENSTKNVMTIPDNFFSGIGGGARANHIPPIRMDINHNRLLYLDPYKLIEGIPELTPL